MIYLQTFSSALYLRYLIKSNLSFALNLTMFGLLGSLTTTFFRGAFLPAREVLQRMAALQ